jgi:transcriptional regulator with XRE-family HTH domain
MMQHRLREIRKNFKDEDGNKVSGNNVAKLLQVLPQRYYDIENYKRRLTAEFACTLADFFGVTLDHLLGRTTESEAPGILTSSPMLLINQKKKLIRSRIKERRVHSGLFHYQVAEVLGIEQGNMLHYESGRVVPSQPVIAQLAELFQTSPDYLLGNTDDPSAPPPPPGTTDWESLSKIELSDKASRRCLPLEVDGQQISQAEWEKVLVLIRIDRKYGP